MKKKEASARPAESLIERLDFCRKMLYVNDLLTDRENYKVYKRITKEIARRGALETQAERT